MLFATKIRNTIECKPFLPAKSLDNRQEKQEKRYADKAYRFYLLLYGQMNKEIILPNSWLPFSDKKRSVS